MKEFDRGRTGYRAPQQEFRVEVLYSFRSRGSSSFVLLSSLELCDTTTLNTSPPQVAGCRGLTVGAGVVAAVVFPSKNTSTSSFKNYLKATAILWP